MEREKQKASKRAKKSENKRGNVLRQNSIAFDILPGRSEQVNAIATKCNGQVEPVPI